MKKRTKILLGFLVAVLCFNIYRQNQLKLNNINPKIFNEYKEAKVQLLTKINAFEKIDRNKRVNKYKYGEPPNTILSMNEYYFKNTISEKVPSGLDEIDDLWKMELLDGQFHNIELTRDSLIWFKTKQIENFDSRVYHYLIFGSKDKIDDISKKKSFERRNRINDNWLNASWRNYEIVELLNM